MIHVEKPSKTFVLRNRGSTVTPVMPNTGFDVVPEKRVTQTGVSGSGKSTLMQMLYGKYLAASGKNAIGSTDVARAVPREILQLCRLMLGYESQFLYLAPRITTRDVIAEPLLATGSKTAEALDRSDTLLKLFRGPKPLWSLSTTIFSGGEQQRINIARGFAYLAPALLLDEPNAHPDAANKRTVLKRVEAAKALGAASVGIFHDKEVRACGCGCDREVEVSLFSPVAAA